MDAASHLYSALGSPRGQVNVRLVPTAPTGYKLLVWVKKGFPASKIPKIFDGLSVEVEDMPTINADSQLSAH